MDFTHPCPTALTGTSSQAFMAVINTLLASQCILTPSHLFPPDYGPHLKNGDEFDFIIVGAGSAGSRVASRLSENPNWKILLLEAGGYPSSGSEIPIAFYTLVKTEEDWGYDFETSKTACLGLKGKTCVCPRGKGLGGSSTINGMLYIRGNQKDYDAWAENGNPGWDFHSVLEHFKKIEDLQGVEDERFGKEGDLKLGQYFNPNPIRETIIKAYRELGYSEYKEEQPIGYLDAYTNIKDGVRYSAAKAFIAKAKNRENLYVALNAQVGKVLVSDDLSVTGVEVRINGQILAIKSRMEVILSAGSVNSPQILMNSGIGPEDHLREMGIPVIKNLKVGQNLQDHIMFTGLIFNVADNALATRTRDDIVDEWYQYFRHRIGPMSRSGIENLILFYDSKFGSKYPTLEMYYTYVHKNDVYGALKEIQNILKLPDEVIETQNENNAKSHLLVLIPSLTYPKSIGEILLRSSNPYDIPKIITNYMSDENDEDIQIMYEGIRFYQNLSRTSAFSGYNPKMVHLDLKNCKHFQRDSEDYWKCALRNLATTVYHLVGTCKMGPISDPNAVVDARLRIYGVKGIRVIDGSIIPKMISCNTNAAIMMIGEKGASMIEEDWTERHTEL